MVVPRAVAHALRALLQVVAIRCQGGDNALKYRRRNISSRESCAAAFHHGETVVDQRGERGGVQLACRGGTDAQPCHHPAAPLTEAALERRLPGAAFVGTLATRTAAAAQRARGTAR